MLGFFVRFRYRFVSLPMKAWGYFLFIDKLDGKRDFIFSRLPPCRYRGDSSRLRDGAYWFFWPLVRLCARFGEGDPKLRWVGARRFSLRWP